MITAEQNARKTQLDSDLRDLCDEVDSLQNRAVRRLEDIENEIQDAQWVDDQEEMIARLQRLVTKV